MNKGDLLALINECKEMIVNLYHKESNQAKKERLMGLILSIEEHYEIIKNADESDRDLFEGTSENYSMLYYKLRMFGKDTEKASEFANSLMVVKNNNSIVIKPKNEIVIRPTNEIAKASEKESRVIADVTPENVQKVTRVIDVENQTEEEKKTNKKLLAWIAGIGGATLVALTIVGLAKENKRLRYKVDEYGDKILGQNKRIESLENQNNKAQIEDIITIEETKEEDPIIKDQEVNEPNVGIDVNSHEVLLHYVGKIRTLLPEGVNYTDEEIINAIKLANFDMLEDQNVFANREELYKATKDLGNLINYAGTDNFVKVNAEDDVFITEDEMKDMLKCITNNDLNIKNFESYKSDNGYDIYKVYEKCAKELNNNVNDINLRTLYAKLFNEITARKLEAFSITADSPLSTYYTMLGMFNANSNASLNLTTNHGWGPTYGNVYNNNGTITGDTIDGTYGFICIEELMNHLGIGNEDYSFYSIYADEFMIQKGLSR